MVETRELAYFVEVARELHFGRAAERLGIAQPPLSRAIARLERRLGVRLLERTSRRVALTPAGETLLAEGAAALEAVAAAVRRTRRAGAADPRLVLALKPGGDGGGLLPRILEACERDPDAPPVEMLFGFGAARALREGRADAALLYAPREDLTGLATEELLSERQIAVVPRDHRLARLGATTGEVATADLEGEVLGHRAAHDGSDLPPGHPPITESGQLLQLIALGRMIAVVPESFRRLLGEDLVAVPVADAPATTLVLAWPEASRSRALAALVRCATGVAAEFADARHAVPHRP